MLLRTVLINLILFSHLIYSRIQINFQYNCIYISIPYTRQYSERQILSFCMDEYELPSKSNHIDPIYTFDQLAEDNVTIEQLYTWSASIDLIEQYQSYLNDPESSLKTEQFYNCTLPYFGPQCQYIFKDLNYSKISLTKMIEEYYYLNRYEPMLFTCYKHLECNRGPEPACLDWTEICDGKIDCLNGGLDEKHCWQLEIVDRCNKNQFQCFSNGQCIPNNLNEENIFSFDCIDQSDEQFVDHNILSFDNELFEGPTFTFEDVSCVKFLVDHSSSWEFWSSSCVKNRQRLFSYAIFSIKPNSLSDECWSVFKCINQIPIESSSICKLMCHDGFCDEILKIKCPNFIVLSAIPFLYGHVNMILDRNELKYEWHRTPPIKYICFDSQQLHINRKYIHLSSLYNQTCFTSIYSIFNGFNEKYHWSQIYFSELHRWLIQNSIIIENNLSIYTNSNIYQCQNWPKFISKRRLRDSVVDCLEKDDEQEQRYVRILNTTVDKENYFQCSDDIWIPQEYVNDKVCDCIGTYDIFCTDEERTYVDWRFSLSFQETCNGIKTTLLETNEHECKHLWPRLHIYNICDGIFNLENGTDELNCDPSPLLNCSSNHHLCVSQQTNQIICLPINKTNDGIIDCIGGIDESQHCHTTSRGYISNIFYCPNNPRQRCISIRDLCDTQSLCIINDYQTSCAIGNNELSRSAKRSNIYQQIDCSDTAKLICKQYRISLHSKYFTLDQRMNLVLDQQTNEDITHTPFGPYFSYIEFYHQRCHRGLDLIVFLDKKINLTTHVCLCPPSYYGSQCQYQNQRVSLTLQFRVSTDSIHIPFIIIISLIDNSQQRIIHSTEQITYLSRKHCQKKFHIYLLYATRPKNQSNEYFLHIDIYEKLTLQYRASLIKQIEHSFLPVHRLVYLLDIPPQDNSFQSCSDRQCQHGRCIQYANDLTNQSFCQCDKGWSGQFCSVEYDCQCSSDALCLGQLANNRSICVCPLHRTGPRCLLEDKTCVNQTCSDRGQCVTLDEYDLSKNKSTCICDQFSDDDFCQVNDAKLILSFDENLLLFLTMSIHFIEIKAHDHPKRTTIFKTIYSGQDSMIIHWPLPYHLVFVQFNDQTYYLALMQKVYKQSSTIETTVRSSDRCLHITELLNKTITDRFLTYRLKYYHQPCQQPELVHLKCFYDNVQLCLCQQIDGYRVANCFKFDHQTKELCTEINACKNGGTCFQEVGNCSRIALCQCPTCFYGSQCEINTNAYYISLDVILGFRISPAIKLNKQPSAVLISLSITTFIVLLGLVNASLSLMTFQNTSVRKSGCGVYLFCSSILTFLTMFVFLYKFLIVLLSQIGTIRNYSFLNIHCYFVDFFFRCSLTIEQWLTAFVAIERAIISIKGYSFKQKQAKLYSKWIISCSILFTLMSNIHDPLHRKLFQENENEQQRYWCIVEYSSELIRVYNSFITMFHFISPFILNFISAIIIVVVKTRKKIKLQDKKQTKTNHTREILIEQIQQHKHILIAPCVLTMLGIPRLILSFTSSCMKTTNDFWFYLIGNYISLIPSLLTFILFVLPSTTYKQTFKKVIKRYRRFLCQ